MAAKAKSTTPEPIKVTMTKKTETPKATVAKKTADKPAENLSQVLGKTEETIQELTRMLAETEDSNHMGVRGMPKLTPKQQAIMKELDEARSRYKEILRLMAGGV